MHKCTFHLILLLSFVACTLSSSPIPILKRRKAEVNKEAEAAAIAEAERLQAEMQAEAEKNKFIIGDAIAALFCNNLFLTVFLAYVVYVVFDKLQNSLKSKKVDIILIGMGLPKKGMGWYHLLQLLNEEGLKEYVDVKGVVEPFFLNSDLCKSVPASFTDFVDENSQIHFVKNVEELDDFGPNTLCLIAGRTMDNPKFFKQCIEKGAGYIYLEKPGASTVKELEEMKELADSNNVKVYLGYNKNVTPYVQKALKLANQLDTAHVLFRHNNSYKKRDLPECFARNSEGMLKNMAIHELALLASFFNITVDSVASFKIDKKISEKLELSYQGKSYTDFSKILFTVTNKKKQSVSIMADRCGGNVSYAAVLNREGKEVGKFEFPDEDELAKVNKMVEADPEMMPYFFVQSDDYFELKSRVVKSILSGEVAEGVATIEIAVDALKLAEFGTDQLMKTL